MNNFSFYAIAMILIIAGMTGTAGAGDDAARWLGNITEDGDRKLVRDSVRIAIVDCKTGKEIMLIATDVSVRPRPDAVSDEFYDYPVMSPDGKNLVYINQYRSQRPQKYEIVVMNLEQNNSRTLYSGTDYPQQPSFSPDGGFLGFSSGKFIYICDSSGENMKKTEISGIAVERIAVFTGGKQAVYCPLDGQNKLVLLDTETKKTTVLDKIASPGTFHQPSVSPDGQWVCYERSFRIESDDMEIRVYDVNSKKMKVLKLNKAGSETYTPKGFTADSKCLICDTGGKFIKIDLATGKIEK